MTSPGRLDLTLNNHERDQLKQYRFNAAAFDELRSKLARGEFPADKNRITSKVEPPRQSDIRPWPDADSAEDRELISLGKTAIAEGQVAVAILNGGMATRFGGRVKGIVEPIANRSFLDLKLTDIVRSGGRVPVFLMNSFATHASTGEHLTQNKYFGLPERHVHMVTQRISMRLRPDGTLHRNEKGNISFYSPGHGDIFEVLAEDPHFVEFAAEDGQYILISNVDNIGATLNPKVIGAHIVGRKKVTVEVTARKAEDKGGAPVKVDGRLEILEGFRFPHDFQIAQVPVFNTNTMVVNCEVMNDDYPLTWFRADKTVDAQPVVQFERLMGEITSFVDSQFLQVHRDGPEGRFMPIKTPADMDSLAPILKEQFA